MGTLQAIGRLRFGPRAPTVPRKGRWGILACDHDWFEMYAPQVHRELPGRWANVIDDNRIPDGGTLSDVEPRLGFVKPLFQEPAWGPHISVIRGNLERVTVHHDLWHLGMDLGDIRQEMHSMVESRKHHEGIVRTLQESLASMRPGVRPKFRKRSTDALDQALLRVAGRTTRLRILREREADLMGQLVVMQKTQDLPDYVLPNAKVQFGFDPELKLIRGHWYLDVNCRTLGRIRQFFGLDPRPLVPFHLTVAVTSGT